MGSEDSAAEKTRLKCLATNFESILNKYEELKIIVNDQHPDVIFGTETWLKQETNGALINIPGYTIFRTDTCEIRGGVIIYINDNLNAVVWDS